MHQIPHESMKKARRNTLKLWRLLVFTSRCKNYFQVIGETSYPTSLSNNIAELPRMADSCEFGMMKDNLIQDRLVVGIQNDLLLEHLQMEAGSLQIKPNGYFVKGKLSKNSKKHRNFPIRKLSALPLQAMKQSLACQDCKQYRKGSHPKMSYVFVATGEVNIAAKLYLKWLQK